MKIEKVFARSKLHTFSKNLKQDTSLFYFLKLVLAKVTVKQMAKAALVLRLEKSIFVCTIFRMDTQLHTQANGEI